MGRNCPLHNIQPVGAKLKLKALISPRNGVVIGAISCLGSGTGGPAHGPSRTGPAEHGAKRGQLRGGNTPLIAMHQFIVNVGCMLSWACPLPAAPTAAGLRVVPCAVVV